jgi:hypothetical protein
MSKQRVLDYLTHMMRTSESFDGQKVYFRAWVAVYHAGDKAAR